MLTDESWPVARLIPITSASGIEAQERRAASALLAVIGAVEEFGRALLKPLGAPAGKIATYVEVPFKVDGKSMRPDGLISVSRGTKQWLALIETKVGASSLQAEQIEMYLDLARQLEFDAVISISNHYVTSSALYPIEIDKRRTRKVALHHWSWVDVLTEAVVQRQHRGVSDPDQAYILQELVRYLKDPRSGAASLGNMGPSWTRVKDGTRDQTLRKNDEHVAVIAAKWDDLVRFLALELTSDLGRDVKQILGKSERTPATRQQGLRDSLVNTGRLYAELQIPNAAGPLEIWADLRSRQVRASTRVEAPQEGRSKGRVSWLLRQLQNASENVKVESKAARTSSTYAATLGVARANPEVLFPEAGREIRGFTVSLTQNMGLKKDAGPGSFIESVITTVEEFYGQVLQNLRGWKAPPPKLKRQEGPVEEAEAAIDKLPSAAREAVEEAETEMTESRVTE